MKSDAYGKASTVAARSKLILAFAVLANVVSLLFFKFSGVFFPVAVSFYTFNQISYIVDMYRGEIEEFSLLDYLAYILFFPKILQGPLMGYGEFSKELEGAIDTDPAIDYELLLRALFLFSMGLFKKVILADTFGQAVNFGFDAVAGLGSLEAILVAVFYSFQLYFDFSGYCDMASAVCMMIGFELPQNFDSPYKAVNILDFWKRWHITLTKFFTKYVYIPLGGNRKGMARMYVNLMIVFLVSGLWHGNGWNFIVWGAMHGVLYVITRMVRGKKEDKLSAAVRVVKTLLTFVYVTLAWVFFRASSIREALELIGRMFVGGHKRIATQLSACFQLDEIWYVIKVTPIMKLPFAWESCMWLFLIVAVAIIFFSKNAITIAKNCKVGVKTTIATAILLVWSIISLAGVSTFLYMNF
ncbi:MBOAT family O-acyltransferase [Butyrivibrio sp. VCB2001]|uniref:MBOAT family O-acyltransferase n=1 Tax=Butyrivibrio sp. VCB2001 TaxID=1280667 RepID=UPI0018CA3214|nr:MBOAT family O-acyltransferase [Butyrivibrio sp. VCB2001]